MLYGNGPDAVVTSHSLLIFLRLSLATSSVCGWYHVIDAYLNFLRLSYSFFFFFLPPTNLFCLRIFCLLDTTIRMSRVPIRLKGSLIIKYPTVLGMQMIIWLNTIKVAQKKGPFPIRHAMQGPLPHTAGPHETNLSSQYSDNYLPPRAAHSTYPKTYLVDKRQPS